MGLDDEAADAGTATFEREKDLSIEQNVRDLLQKIDRALSRIDAGTYGICERCGKPIEKARVKALPYVSLSASRTPRRKSHGRSVDARRAAGQPSSSSTAAVVFAVDRLTKLWAAHALADKPIDLIRGVLTLRYTTNSGGAFSLGQRTPWLFAAATLIVSGLIVAHGVPLAERRVRPGAGSRPRGRARQPRRSRPPRSRPSGHVVDFIDLHWWPVFNVADSAIVIGAVVIAWASFREERPADVAAGAPDDVP